jgi:hypothetical protein
MSDPYDGQSSTQDVPGVSGTNTAEGDGVFGSGRRGVVGESDTFQGVFGKSRDNAGIVGESTNFHAVFGISHDVHNAGVFGANDAGGFGVIGTCDANIGVAGDSKTGSGVRGTSQSGTGVEAWSDTNYGITGQSRTFPGVRGTSAEGRAVEGWSTNNDGIWGITTGNIQGAAGVHGVSEGQSIGVFGQSVNDDGVRGVSTNRNGVSAFGGHTGVYAKGPVNAGYFEGNIYATGSIACYDVSCPNADCAEDFDIAADEMVEPGTVMVLCDEATLHPSEHAYDKHVIGVISGAGNYRPAIVLDKQPEQGKRLPVALLGKVFCKVDAGYGAIEVGDLLTTSTTPGHAMKATDSSSAFGAVIGKALRPLREGQGLIPIVIALQ